MPDQVELFVNEKRVGLKVIVGPQPDLGFFEQLAPHLHGRCEVRFRVGDKVVDNEIVFSGHRYDVRTTFTPFDVAQFVADEKHRVRTEQEEAQFTDSLTDVYFVPARTLLSWGSSIPSFNLKTLTKDPAGPRYFISHPWLAVHHPDPKGKHLALIQQHARRFGQDACYWIDYSCLPQPPRSLDQQRLFNETLPKIATIQSKGSTIAIVDHFYRQRMWCYIEHFAGVSFSLRDYTGVQSSIEYIGDASATYDDMMDKVQTLEQPAWTELNVTEASDIPGIKYNYRFLATLARFQLHDRFMELLQALPGHDVYSGYHYSQSSFGLDHSKTLRGLRPLFFEFGGDMQYFYKEKSLLWLARRFSWSVTPDEYKIDELQFCQYLYHSETMVGWTALLLGILKLANQGNDSIVNFREQYAQIVLMSLFR